MSLSSQALVRIVGDESNVLASLKRTNAAVEASDRQFQRDFGSISQTAQRTALAVVAAGTVMAAGTMKAVRTAAEAEAVWNKLEAQLGKVGIGYGSVEAEINRTAMTLQKFTRFGDEDTASTLQKLIAITGSYQKSLSAVELVMDVAIGTGMALEASTNLVGKGLIGVTSEFRRYGIVLKEGEDATEALRRKFGGLAREDGKTLEAQLQRITNATDDLFEAFGNSVAGDEAATSVGGIADAIWRLAESVEQNEDKIHDFFQMLAEGGSVALRAFTEGDIARRAGGAAGGAVHDAIGSTVGRGLSASLFYRDQVLYGDEHANRSLSIRMNGRGQPLRSTADLSALRGTTWMGPTIGLGGNDPWLTNNGPTPSRPASTPPFPESPAIRAAREAAEAAALQAEKDAKALADERSKAAKSAVQMIRELGPMVQPLDPRNPIDPFTGTNRDIMGRTMDAVRPFEFPRTPMQFPTSTTATSMETAQRMRMDAATQRMREDHDRFTNPDAGRELIEQLEAQKADEYRKLSGALAAASTLGGVATGQQSPLSGLSSILGMASGYAGGTTGLALGGAASAVSLLQSVWGDSRQREEESYRAHLRALRDSRREVVQFTFILPKAYDAKDPAWREVFANTLLELGDGRIGRVNVETR